MDPHWVISRQEREKGPQSTPIPNPTITHMCPLEALLGSLDLGPGGGKRDRGRHWSLQHSGQGCLLEAEPQGRSCLAPRTPEVSAHLPSQAEREGKLRGDCMPHEDPLFAAPLYELLLCSRSVLSDSLQIQDCSPRAPLSMGFSRQEDGSGGPFPSPGDHPDPGIKPGIEPTSLRLLH